MSDKREPTEAEILQGFARLEIKLENGQPSLLEVRVLSIRKIQEFFAAQAKGDQARSAEILTGKPEGWADSIPVGEVFRILEVGERLNMVPFGQFVRFGHVQAGIMRQILTEAERLASSASSPTSASPPA